MDRRKREAGETVIEVVQAMIASSIPVDSCILAGEIARDTGRALGYRARIVPVRVRARGPEGEEGRDLGYTIPGLHPMMADRYNGHVVATWDDKIALDPTAPQMTEKVPALTFEVPRGFAKGQATQVCLPNGWIVTYEPFDDSGDWARGLDGATTRRLQQIGKALAKRIRPR